MFQSHRIKVFAMKVRQMYAGLALSALLLSACGQGGDLDAGDDESPLLEAGESTGEPEESDSAKEEGATDDAAEEQDRERSG